MVGQAHLPEQFWSPARNSRTNEFGGSLENRQRFDFMVLEEIRRQAGDDFIVGIRIAIDQNLEGGLSQADCLEIARIHHHAAERSGYRNCPVYLRHFYDKGVTLTPDLRLQKVEGDGARLRAVFANELTDQVVVERGTVPVDDLFEKLRTESCNDGAVDPDRLLAGLPL